MAKSSKSRFRDFGKTQALEDYEPLGFALNDEEFSCRPAIAGATLLEFISQADSESGAAAEAIVRFIEESLDGGDRERFTAMIHDPDQIVEVETLGNIAGWLIEQYSVRPTKARSRSAAGRSTTGRGSTDISLVEE